MGSRMTVASAYRRVALILLLAVPAYASPSPAGKVAPTPAVDAGSAADVDEHNGATPDTTTEPIVRYDGKRLSIRATRMPASRVLEAVARETGAAIRGGMPSREVTVRVESLPVAKALTAVVGSDSFMLTYGKHGSLRAITLIGTGQAAAASGAPALPTPIAMMPQPTPYAPTTEQRQAAILNRTFTVSTTLAQALGTIAPTANQIVRGALTSEDADTRGLAREALFTAFTTDPEIESAYLSTLAPVEDKRLATMLRSMGQPGAAEDLLTALSERASSSELRYKATSVRAVLRSSQ